MVQAIDFVVRNSAGAVVRGEVAGSGSNFVQMGVGEEISLNLARESIAGYVQQGNDLVVSLADGRQIVLAGYFNSAEGVDANQLYLSQNGEVVAVDLTAAGDGTLYASYGATDSWDKFSTLDDLRFAEGDDLALAAGAVSDEPAGMAGFIPGLVGMGGAGAGLAGLGLLGALAGGGGGGDGGGNGGGGSGGGGAGGGGGTGGSGHTPPTVNGTGTTQTVTTNTTDKDLDVTGTGHPGDTVVVTIGGVTSTTTIGTNGTWAVTIPGTGLPPDGTHVTTVVVTHPGGTTTTLTGPTFVLDLTPPAVEVTDGTKSVGDIENLVEYADGVTIAGEGEPGATINVQIGTHIQTTTVAANGTWSVTFTQTQVAPGEYEIPVTITATDPLGNTTVLNDILVIDTVPHPITFNAVTADNTVNGSEATAGFTITGTSTAGATISVTLQGVTQQVTVGANGTWSVSWAAGTLTAGEYDATITATTVDGAGNTSSQTHTFRVDTVTSVAFDAGAVETDNIVNAAEAADGVTLTGTAQAGSTVSVLWNGVTLAATVGANGAWTVSFPASSIPAGTYSSVATVTATDAAGNTATATRTIQIDTDPNVIGFADVTSGNIVNGAEAQAGFVLSGTGTAGATISVTLQGVTQQTVVGANGQWSFNWAAGSLMAGEYDATITATSTDAAGNPSTGSHTFRVDTSTSVAFAPGMVETDNIVNGTEASDGVVLTGTAQAGATVSVAWNGQTLPATVDASGNWTVTFPASSIPANTTLTSTTATVTATDAAGNTATATRTISIDTGTSVSINATQMTDNVASGAERTAGLTFTGQAEAGATVTVTFDGKDRVVTAGANGAWSVSYAAADVRAGTYDSSINVTARDAAGNTATATHAIKVDTEVTGFDIGSLSSGTDGINEAEASAGTGVQVTGTVEPFSSVVVTFGSGTPQTVTAGADGVWTATIPSSQIPAGETNVTLTAVATDRYGNVSSTLTEDVRVDRIVNNLTRLGGTIGGDGVLNAAEVGAGLTLNGTVEPNSTVVVTLSNGSTHTVAAGASGTWSVTFPAGELPTGDGVSVTAKIHATDSFGNTREISETFSVDTTAPGAPNVTSIFSEVPGGLFGIGTNTADADFSFYRVNATGAAQSVAAEESFSSFRNETQFQFQSAIPDGSYLVINTEDAAGNESSTLFVVNNTTSTTVDLNRDGLDGFDLSAIDLTKAPDASLTITEQQLLDLTGPDKTLMIKGDGNDTVTASGAVDTGDATVVGGQSYSIYHLGTGGTLLLDDDIKTVI